MFTFCNYYVLKLLRLETITFSDATLNNINVVLCYVLSQYHLGFQNAIITKWFVQERFAKEKSFGLEKSKECRRISNNDITVLRNVSYLFYERPHWKWKGGRERFREKDEKREWEKEQREEGEGGGRGGGEGGQSTFGGGMIAHGWSVSNLLAYSDHHGCFLLAFRRLENI